MASIVISGLLDIEFKISALHAKAKVISSVLLDWLAAILTTPLYCYFYILRLEAFLEAVSDEFRDICLPLSS